MNVITNKLYVLKHENGKYYSDGAFIEPEKKFAQRLRLGQAKSIKRNEDRHSFSEYAANSLISIEEA